MRNGWKQGYGRWQGVCVLMWVFGVIGLGLGCGSQLRIHGVVVNPDGGVLPGMDVMVFEADAEAFGAEQALAVVRTDGAGRFAFDAVPSGRYVLQVVGEKGTGRVSVSASARPDTITYPVRTTLVILHDNDMHFNFNYLEAFRAGIEDVRARYDNVFLFNAGDIFIRHAQRWPEPGPEGYLRRAMSMIETMNALEYDAMTVGNHELDYIDDLTRQALAAARFPVLGANAEIATDRLLPLKPYVIFRTTHGYTIAVLGLTILNNEKEGVQMLDPFEVARAHVHLADEHDVFVSLTHLGVRTERRLAEEVPQFDVIIGGHSHTLLKEGEWVGDVLIAQAGGSPGGHLVSPTLPKYLGKVKLVLENGRLVEKEARVMVFDE